jgi:hypothetical protein
MSNHFQENIIFTNIKARSNGKNILYLNDNEIDHCKHFYLKYRLIPNSYSSVTIEFAIQKTKYLRFLLKELDLLLKTSGKFIIILVDSGSHSKFLRSRSQIKYEFSLATNGRYVLEDTLIKERLSTLVYSKKKDSLIKDDSIGKWTFGVISNGKKNPWVLELIKSIQEQNIPNYEVLIVGPNPYSDSELARPDHVKILEDVVLIEEKRPPISHKKNKIIKKASYNNLCILHDRYLLPKNWFLNFQEYGNHFEILCLKTLNLEGKRYSVDWMKFHYPITSRFKLNRALLYDEWSDEAIIPGGAIIMKKNLVKEFLLDERLFWDEMEDFQLSKMANLNGLLINVDKNNHFISREVRHKVKEINWFRLKVIESYGHIKAILKNFILFELELRKFKKDKKR